MNTVYKTILIFAFVFTCNIFASAQTEREKGIAFYQKADYKMAIKTLKKAAKKNSADFQSLFYLGLAYLKTDEPKEASKVLEKAVALDDKNVGAFVALAYSYLVLNEQSEAQKTAEKALKLNPKNADAHYILGVLGMRRESFNYAYEQANKAIELNPNHAAAYYLKSEALVNSFAAQSGTIMRPAENRYELLTEAAESLDKFLRLSPDDKQADFLREYLKSLQFFADYYQKPENRKPFKPDPAESENSDVTNLKITYKPKPHYTNEARKANISGSVKVLTQFDANGKIGNVLVTKTLGYGLDEMAVRAVKGIKFEPRIKDGKPVSVVRTVVLTFTLLERIGL